MKRFASLAAAALLAFTSLAGAQQAAPTLTASGYLLITGPSAQTALNANLVMSPTTGGALDVAPWTALSLQIVPTGTVSSGVVTFEGSNDNVNFVALPLYDKAAPSSAPVTTVSPSTGVIRYMEGPLTFRYFRARISTIIGGGGSIQAFSQISGQTYIPTTGQAQVSGSTSLTPGTAATNLGKAEDAVAASADVGVFTLGVRRDTLTTSAANGDYQEYALDTYGSQQVRSYEKQARTYSATASITAAASATDIATITGNGSTTVYVTRILIDGVQTTGGMVDVSLIKRSTANSGGTSGAMTAIPNDSSDAAASATLLAYTANPTPGTAVGTVRRAYVGVPAPATAVGNSPTVFEFGDKGRPIVLRGTTQVLAVNLNGVTVTGGVFTISIEWFEI